MSRGFTIVELAVVLALVLLTSGAVMVIVNPAEIRNKMNDSRRMSEISLLSQAISSYKISNGYFPDALATPPIFRQSATLPSGQTALNSAAAGWIVANLSPFMPKLYTDPVNSGNFVYRYTHNATTYEIDCALAFYSQESQTDNGNNLLRYELGSNLNLLN